jgi:hypothetical protein
MCFGKKPPQDNSAAIARQQAAEREQRVGQGKEKIDQAFSVFDPQYFDKFQSDYLNYYNPQVDEQFGDARQNLKYDLYRSGTQDSTPGQQKFGDLIEDYGNRRREVASKALEATNAIRSSVEGNKSDLYQQNVAASDPSLAAISATGRAGSLSTPPAFSPLADLFGGGINAGASYLAGRNKALPAGYQNAFSAPKGGSASYVVS